MELLAKQTIHIYWISEYPEKTMYLSQVIDKLYHIYISTLDDRNSTNLSKFINNHIFEICKVKTNIYNSVCKLKLGV